MIARTPSSTIIDSPLFNCMTARVDASSAYSPCPLSPKCCAWLSIQIPREKVHRVHNPTQKKAHCEPANGRIRIAPAANNIRVLPPFPPNNATRPAPCTPKKEGHQWCKRRNEKGQTYYVNTKTSECQMETPDCFKKYTAK